MFQKNLAVGVYLLDCLVFAFTSVSSDIFSEVDASRSESLWRLWETGGRLKRLLRRQTLARTLFLKATVALQPTTRCGTKISQSSGLTESVMVYSSSLLRLCRSLSVIIRDVPQVELDLEPGCKNSRGSMGLSVSVPRITAWAGRSSVRRY